MQSISFRSSHFFCIISALLFFPILFSPPAGRCESAIENSSDTSWIDDAQAAESSRMAPFKDIAQRSRNKLRIKLENGKYKTLKNENTDGDSEDLVAYTFTDYLKDIGYVLAHIQYWEGDEYAMVNIKNGKTFIIAELPNISPDKKNLAAVSADVAYNFNGIEIWKFTKNGMIKDWSYSPKGFRAFKFEKWTENNELIVSSEAGVETRDGKYVNVRALYTVKNGPKGWIISEPGEKITEKK